jgi:ribulose-5-phosphate 4-epimerase/fuculose-1-phosphate aldolase
MTKADDSAIRARVLQASHALAAAGQQDMIWGHVAIRDPDGRGVWIKRAGIGFDELTIEDIHLVGWDGQVIHGQGKPHIECHIHLSIMAKRLDVMATVHTHPAAVNAFSALSVPLRAISHEGVLFAGSRLGRSSISGDLVANEGRGAELAMALGERRACLMPRHGLVAVGVTEAAAVMHAVLLEAACATFLRASSAGDIRSWSDAEEIDAKTMSTWPSSQIDAGYAFLLRRSEHAAI